MTALGGGTLAALAGCLGTGNDDEPGTLRMGSQWGVGSLDPMEGSTQLQRIGIFESLVSLDWDVSIQPQLATDWETIDDQTWEFTLRDDVTFHDGEEFDADAMVFSLERTLDEGLSTLPIESVDATSEYTIEVKTTEPFAPLLAHLTRRSTVAMSPASVDDGDVIEPVGTGPFIFESWTSEAGDITLSRNDEYYGTVPAVTDLVYENVDDGQTRELKLRNDEVDIATQISPTAATRIEEEADTTTQTYSTPRLRYCSFNLTEPPVDDVRVRQAFMSGIDMETIVNELLDGYGEPAAGLLPPLAGDWHVDGIDPYAHDPETATSLLEDAGWESNSDGVRTRDGEPLEITLWTYDSRPALSTIAEAIQNQLSEVGFDAEVRVTDWGAMDDAKESGEASMTLESTTVFADPSDPDRLRFFVHTEEGKAVGYETDRIDELLAAGRHELDREERVNIYHEVQEIAHEELPVAPLTYQENVIGLQSRVEGTSPIRQSTGSISKTFSYKL